jgi:pimeloyl-ACP methyl ester carboxylesterase
MPYATLADVRLYYDDLRPDAPAAGAPLLLLHGLGSSTRDWARQTGAFARRRRVLALDLRGHGRSSKPPGPYSVPLFARDTVALLDHLGVEAAHVVGLSMGGMVAFQLAARHLPRVRSLTIVNSGPAVRLDTWRLRAFYRARRLAVKTLGMAYVGRTLARRLFVRPEDADVRAAFAARWAENDPRAYLAALDGFIGWSVEEHLPAMACPALVVAADHDYTPVAAKEAYVRRLPDARLAVMDDARHAAPVEHPHVFNALLADFLAEVEGNAQDAFSPAS